MHLFNRNGCDRSNNRRLGATDVIAPGLVVEKGNRMVTVSIVGKGGGDCGVGSFAAFRIQPCRWQGEHTYIWIKILFIVRYSNSLMQYLEIILIIL